MKPHCLQIDYKYNSRAMASPSPLLNLHVASPIDGGFKSLHSKPLAQWLPDSNRVLWKFTELSQHSEGGGVGCLKARIELDRGPGSQGTIFTQFNCEGTTLSGVEFELVGAGYRLSLVKRRFVSGKSLRVSPLISIVRLTPSHFLRSLHVRRRFGS